MYDPMDILKKIAKTKEINNPPKNHRRIVRCPDCNKVTVKRRKGNKRVYECRNHRCDVLDFNLNKFGEYTNITRRGKPDESREDT